MSQIRPFLVVAVALPALLLGACSSDDEGSTSESSTTTEASSMTDETTGSSTTASGSATETELPDPCEALTAEEFTSVTGLTATAEVDDFLPTACNYLDADQLAYATLTVGPGTTTEAIIEDFIANPPPGATFTEVQVGDAATVAGPPEGRALVVADGIGYDFSKSFGGDALPVDQLEALLQAMIA